MATDRSSEASQSYTLTVGSRTYSGWSEVSVPDQDIVTGTYAAGGSRSQTVTVGQVSQTGTYVLTKQFNASEYDSLDRDKGKAGSVAGARVDTDNRIVATYQPRQGVLKGVSRGGMKAASGDPLMMMARFEADG